MLAIIPARGGSKGLPRKNIKLLDGLPLICHSIKAALDSKLVDRVIVSTEDDEIAAISKDCGAEIPFMRPKELATDESMVMDTYLDIIDKISKENDKSIDNFVALLPTTPLRNSNDIDKAIEIFNNKNANSVISVTETLTPLHWCRKITKEGILTDYLPNFNAVKNRQNFTKAYVPNGAIYIFKTEVLRKTREYYTDKTFPYLMPIERSVDIDNLIDFKWAEYLMNNKI